MTVKRIKVVMLPTNEKATRNSICLNTSLSPYMPMVTGFDEVEGTSNKHLEVQHLYFLSDEEIKEGDWILYTIHCSNRLSDFDTINEKAMVTQYNSAVHQNIRYCKKIIATTDSYLKIEQPLGYLNINPNTWDEHKVMQTKTILLPQPSQDFIKVFVDAYNAGNVIEWVDVEYVDNGEEDWIGDDYNGEPFWNEKLELKVNSKNEITIRKIKDSWSREEVIKLIEKHTEYMFKQKITLDEWISKNL